MTWRFSKLLTVEKSLEPFYLAAILEKGQVKSGGCSWVTMAKSSPLCLSQNAVRMLLYFGIPLVLFLDCDGRLIHQVGVRCFTLSLVLTMYCSPWIEDSLCWLCGPAAGPIFCGSWTGRGLSFCLSTPLWPCHTTSFASMFSKNLFGVDFFAGKQSVYHGFCQALKFACVCEFVWFCPVFLLHSFPQIISKNSLSRPGSIGARASRARILNQVQCSSSIMGSKLTT